MAKRTKKASAKTTGRKAGAKKAAARKPAARKSAAKKAARKPVAKKAAATRPRTTARTRKAGSSTRAASKPAATKSAARTKAAKKPAAKKVAARTAASGKGAVVSKGLARVARRVAPILKRVARVVAPIAAVSKRAAAKPAPKAPAKAKAAAPPVTKAAAKKTVARRPPRVDAEPVRETIPSSLEPGGASAARSGREEMLEHLKEHTETGPSITAGDLDADWQTAYSSGDEAPGGDNPTPDQDIVDDIGHALGVEYGPTEELQGANKIEERDKHRWELDPASSDDYAERRRDEE